MVLWEMIKQKGWIFLLSAGVMLLGFCYGMYQIGSDRYGNYSFEEDLESWLDEILMDQQHFTEMDGLEYYSTMDQSSALAGAYLLCLDNMIQANQLIDLAQEKAPIMFTGNVPSDFVENRKAYASMERASIINPYPLSRFFCLERYDFSFLTGILLAVCFWGSQRENGISCQLLCTCVGRSYRWKCHLVLMTTTLFFVLIGWNVSFVASGLVSVPQYWDAMVRSYNTSTNGWFCMELLNHTVLESALLLLGNHLCNGLIFYLVGYGFVCLFGNIRSAFLGSFSVLLAFYFVGNIFRAQEMGAWMQLGYQGDVTKWFSQSAYLSDWSLVSLEAGAILCAVVLFLALILWVLLESRNPYRAERRLL